MQFTPLSESKLSTPSLSYKNMHSPPPPTAALYLGKPGLSKSQRLMHQPDTEQSIFSFLNCLQYVHRRLSDTTLHCSRLSTEHFSLYLMNSVEDITVCQSEVLINFKEVIGHEVFSPNCLHNQPKSHVHLYLCLLYVLCFVSFECFYFRVILKSLFYKMLVAR